MTNQETNQLNEAIERAKQSGFQIETAEIMPGTTGYQLKDPSGKYVQFGGSEESVWRHAYERGLLPKRSESAGGG